MDTSKVTRLEVIDCRPPPAEATMTAARGRVYSVTDASAKVELSLQDDGRTLKVFFFNEKSK